MFANIVFCVGVFFYTFLRIPFVQQRFSQVHPLKVDLQKKRRLAMLFIIVGAAWGLQNLYLG